MSEKKSKSIFGVEYLTTKATAEILGVTPQSVARWVLQGELTATKIGKNWYLTESNIKDFLTEKTKIGVAKS